MDDKEPRRDDDGRADDWQVFRVMRWFASLDQPTQGNIRLTAIMAAVGVAIYTKPDVFGPWFKAVMELADIKTWGVICMGIFTVFNMAASGRAKERRLEKCIADLELHVAHLEARMDMMQVEHRATVKAVARQRDRCQLEASHYRSTISLLSVEAAAAGAAERALEIVRDLDARLTRDGLRGVNSGPAPGGDRAGDGPAQG